MLHLCCLKALVGIENVQLIMPQKKVTPCLIAVNMVGIVAGGSQVASKLCLLAQAVALSSAYMQELRTVFVKGHKAPQPAGCFVHKISGSV